MSVLYLVEKRKNIIEYSHYPLLYGI